MQSLADAYRLIHNLVRVGTVAELDHANARARFTDGDLRTEWLPWFERRAGTTRDWDPPTVGEQAMLFSPGGDPAAGVVLTGIFSAAHPAPADDPDLRRRTYPDGAIIEYDHKRHHLQATIPGSATLDAQTDVAVNAGAGISATAVADISAETQANLTATVAGVATVTAEGGAVINANTVINGNLAINGTITGAPGYTMTIGSPVKFNAATDFAGAMTHNGKTIDSSHSHSGVQSGNSNTGDVT